MSDPITRPGVQVTETGDFLPDKPIPCAAPVSKSTGHDANDNNTGNINKVVIDFGKSVNSVVWCVVLCSICTVVTVGTVWHHKEREVETQAQIRVLKNHIDDAYNKLAVIEKLEEKRK
jgi:hypothetical protein